MFGGVGGCSLPVRSDTVHVAIEHSAQKEFVVCSMYVKGTVHLK